VSNHNKNQVFYGERSKGHYGEAVFVVSNIISSFPFIVLTSLLSGTIIYFMVQFHPGLTNYAFFCINLFCSLFVVESCIMVVASLVPNVLMGIGTGTGATVSIPFFSEIITFRLNYSFILFICSSHFMFKLLTQQNYKFNIYTCIKDNFLPLINNIKAV